MTGEAGGFLDQDPMLEADKRAMSAWFQRVKWDLEHPTDGDWQAPQNAVSFKDLNRVQ